MIVVDEIGIAQTGSFTCLRDFQWDEAREGAVCGRSEIAAEHLAPDDHLHGAVIVTLADMACGSGYLASLPNDITSFAIAELKTNFIATAKAGVARCEVHLVYAGGTTQIGDPGARSETTRQTIVFFRCTQMLFDRPGSTCAPLATICLTRSKQCTPQKRKPASSMAGLL